MCATKFVHRIFCNLDIKYFQHFNQSSKINPVWITNEEDWFENWIILLMSTLDTLKYLLREQDVISEQVGKFSQNS